MQLNKTRRALVAATLTMMGVLSACTTVGGGGGGETAAEGTKAPDPACKLATAQDPGNSAPPQNVPVAENAPKLAKKDTYRVAFSQNASNNPWRLAETESMKAEAGKLGHQLTITDAQNSQAKQIQDIRSLIAQKPDALFIAPITEQLANVVVDAAKADIPVFLLDRAVDTNIAKPGEHYVTVIRSDFVQEGLRAAVALARATGGRANIVELEGTTGSSPAIDRKKGFDEAIKQCPGMKIVASQDADFTRAKGQQVMETLLQSNPDVNAVYAHNDEMAIGAISAIKAAGKTPGKDVVVVSIDGSRDALQAVSRGELYATVECNPRFGPAAFKTMQEYAEGKPVPTVLVNQDRFFDQSNAKQFIEEAY
ncbi:ABC transporter substrate-binding protein [Thermoactinospora rubra]|uniref:ABC transporter substrate-binding protein n=1 Tax=Thermoactinospora rubra TaxID=1088767 RepID=UPI00197DC460|nr:ABC transporter substrate-binding protein [Thermoactinospora rubra]